MSRYATSHFRFIASLLSYLRIGLQVGPLIGECFEGLAPGPRQLEVEGAIEVARRSGYEVADRAVSVPSSVDEVLDESFPDSLVGSE